jgi:hypothetical protein
MLKMKTQILITILTVFLSLGTFGCNSESPVETSAISDQASLELMKETIASLPTEDLSDEEIAGLLYMREEEKLARDVYITLYQKYGIRVFNNISSAEQTHTDAIKLLLEKYSLTDPVQNDAIGNFVNQDLQNLYNQLVESGSVSDVDALKAGALIEEVDILDLINQINEKVDNQDIIYVYNNLKKGSENHLRAFVKNLSKRSVVYSPVYLDIDTYNAIINN